MILSGIDCIESPEFRRRFNIADDVSKIIVGFLCFDHQNIDFFEREDAILGSVVADMLTPYVVQMLDYTEHSVVFKESLNLFQKHNLSYGGTSLGILGL